MKRKGVFGKRRSKKGRQLRKRKKKKTQKGEGTLIGRGKGRKDGVTSPKGNCRPGQLRVGKTGVRSATEIGRQKCSGSKR